MQRRLGFLIGALACGCGVLDRPPDVPGGTPGGTPPTPTTGFATEPRSLPETASVIVAGTGLLDGVGARLGSADVDDDGSVDLIVSGAFTTWVVPGPVDRDLDLSTADPHIRAGSTRVRTGTFTADGRPGLLVRETPTRLAVHQLHDDLLPVATVDIGASEGAAFTTGDLDGDGLGDAVITHHDRFGSWSEVRIWRGPFADGPREPDHVLTQETHHPYIADAVAVAPDLDGDGIDDLLVANYSGDKERWILPGPPPATLALADAEYGWQDGRLRSWIGAGDIDGDGHNDLVGVEPLGWVVVDLDPLDTTEPMGDGEARLQPPVDSWVGWRGESLGDRDGDGIAEVAVASLGPSESTALPGYVAVFAGPTAGTLTAADAVTQYVAGPDGWGLGLDLHTADWDGDGFPEVAIGAADCVSDYSAIANPVGPGRVFLTEAL